MKTKKSQEFEKLLNSVRAQFNLSNELESRREEAEQRLSQHEQAFIEKFRAGIEMPAFYIPSEKTIRTEDAQCFSYGLAVQKPSRTIGAAKSLNRF